MTFLLEKLAKKVNFSLHKKCILSCVLALWTKKSKKLKISENFNFFNFWSDLPKKINLLKIFFLTKFETNIFKIRIQFSGFCENCEKTCIFSLFFHFFVIFCHFMPVSITTAMVSKTVKK